VGDDPWDARTLEWSIPSPPPEYNFAKIPIVTARDDLWHRKYTEDEEGRAIPRETSEEHAADKEGESDDDRVISAAATEGTGTEVATANGDATATPDVADTGDDNEGERVYPSAHDLHIHMPSPSYWPLFTSLGLAVVAYGMIYRIWLIAILGGIWILTGIFGWGIEPSAEPESEGGQVVPDHDPDDSAEDGHEGPGSESPELEPVGS
ncbi:MAG TPA: cytochrome c oxidase subunit 4, partial [Acidimicrobiales bacterium]